MTIYIVKNSEVIEQKYDNVSNQEWLEYELDDTYDFWSYKKEDAEDYLRQYDEWCSRNIAEAQVDKLERTIKEHEDRIDRLLKLADAENNNAMQEVTYLTKGLECLRGELQYWKGELENYLVPGKIEEEKGFTKGSNVFHSDFSSMGIPIDTNEKTGERLLIMISTNDVKNGIFTIADELTGRRYKITIDRKESK